MKKLILILVALALLGAGLWYFLQPGIGKGSSGGSDRKVAFYQSPMHPWIKSDRPGNCTICGMKLTPIMEGEKGFDTDPNLIPLSSNSISVINVQTEAATNRPIEKTVRASGRIEADETQYRIISAYVDGRVEKLHVNYVGAEVAAGTPLAEIYSPALLTAEREYISLIGRSGTNATRFNEDHDALLGAARERLRRLGLSGEQIAALAQKGETNDTTGVLAPISGTVIKRNVFEGQYVKEGDPLFELANLDTMWFKFDLFEQDIPWVHGGAKVQVTTPALPGQMFEGELKFIDPTLNPMTRSAKARVELANPINQVLKPARRLLMNGMFAEAKVILQTERVLSVPRSAVLQASADAIVFVEGDGGMYERRKIKIGRKGDSYYEVLSGLQPGDKVVTSGNLLLDSQSQLNPSIDHFHQSDEEQPAPETSSKWEPTEAQESAASALFTAAHGLGKALAADDLPSFQRQLTNANETSSRFGNAFQANASDLPNFAQQIDIIATGMPTAGEDLNEARKNFEPWSRAVVDFAREWKKVRPQSSVKLYRCPMYPKPGKSAFWVQLEASLRNPYYGAEMLDCGTEVQ